MQKTTLSIILMALVVLSCDKDDNNTKTYCNCTNPLEELVWLKEMKNQMTDYVCELSLMQGMYKNQEVFYRVMTDPLCDGILTTITYDCDGNIVKKYTVDKIHELQNDITETKVLYRCKNIH